MAPIIEQIQRDSLDRSVRVSDLLRRVKLAATKLGLGAVEDWVEQELNGYNALPFPDYRVIHGRPKFQRPTTGAWELIGGHVEGFSSRNVGQSIASLEELASAPNEATIHFTFSDSFLERLNESNGTRGWLAALEVDRSAIVSILDRVRNLVLDWALKMEAAGVVGTEFSFNAADKQKAQGATTMINIGSIGSFAGNLGSENATRDVTVRGVDLTLVEAMITQLKSKIDDLAAAGADGATLKARLNSLEAEIGKVAPTSLVLRGLLVDIRNAVAGATGNLMASGAIALINQLLGTGVPGTG